MIFPGFCGPSNIGPAKSTNPEDCINFYQELQPPESNGQLPLIGVQGLLTRLTYSVGPIRGLKNNENFAMIVSGGQFYAIDDDNATFLNSAILNDNLPVRMVSGVDNNLILSAGIVYYTNNVGVTPVVSPPWTQPLDIEYVNGFFIVLDGLDDAAVGGRIFVSAPSDPTTWSALDFIDPMPSDNKYIALRENHGQLWIFGNRITIPMYVIDEDVPFAVNTSGVMAQGAFTRDTIVKMRQSASIGDDTLYILSRDANGHLNVVRFDGYQPVKISTPALDRILESYTDPFNSTAWAFEDSGHAFLQFNFITDNMSWRYDVMTGFWNKTPYLDPISGEFAAHLGSCHMFKNETHYVGSRLTGKIYELSSEFYDDDGDALLSERVAPILSKENKLIPHGYLELDIESGVGNGSNDDTDPANDPQISMWFSNDAGNNWVTMGDRSMGKQGEYDKRVRFEQLGSARQRVYRARITAAVKRVINGAYIGL